ncbi:MAG: hypothetical protein H6811_04170 [Phycisphaeraceae bacterium]|nr:hypothetical protein [Phycisphaeraceae bacterium]
MRTAPQGDSFYVGYLAIPDAHRRWLRFVVPPVVVVVIALGAVFAAAQRDPGTGRHRWAHLRQWSGTLAALPQPVLVGEDGAAMLIVQMGKHGAIERLGELGGARVRLSGRLIERGGRRMVELDDAESAVVVVEPADTHVLPMSETGEVALFRGEILDAKCWLGAMKPGDGKTHKACATLCIAGGIPPLLFAIDSDGRARQFLLTTESGQSLTALVLPFVGEPVNVRGRRAAIADLEVLVLGPESIERATP